jgi:hypothetical protein
VHRTADLEPDHSRRQISQFLDHRGAPFGGR